jgi:hypothetical protein
LLEFCGKAIAALLIAAPTRDCENKVFAVVKRNWHESHADFSDDPDRQKRSCAIALRLVFINAGISNLSTDAGNRYSSSKKAFVVVRDREVFLCKAFGLVHAEQRFFHYG